MGKWITSKSPTIQSDIPNKHLTLFNQLYMLDNTIYLIPRNTITDNYTIPFGIDKDKYDVRPSHLHDIACKYHEVIIVDLPLEEIINKYIYTIKDKIYCKDIPIEYLKIKKVSFKNTNKLLYNSMVDTNTIPKYICRLYYIGVYFNINYIFTGKDNIILDNIYNNILYTISNKDIYNV